MILSALLKQHGRSLNNESLITLLAEVKSIVNSRPLTVEILGDVAREAPLSPINVLIMKSNVVLPPPGNFRNLICTVVDTGENFGAGGERKF